MSITLYPGKVVWLGGEILPDDPDQAKKYQAKTGKKLDREALRDQTMAWPILQAHSQAGDQEELHIRFDAISSHDITYVGIIQTAIASGMEKFPLPYVLTNCHNSLCAVGGTINEDDHKFALSAAKKFGGIYVPPNMAVIHSYNRECLSAVGRMVLGSDSHTRYGGLGTLAIGEGGGELAKQLLSQTYDIVRPDVVGVVLRGEVKPWVGPQDVALAIEKAVFDNGFTKNKVMEFIGEGLHKLPVEFRNGVDVMTTETTCLSSIWRTDDKVAEYYRIHGRPEDYRELREGDEVCYDGIVEVDLSSIEPMIALPYHPSNVYTVREVQENPMEILRDAEEKAQVLFEGTGVSVDLTSKVRDGKVYCQQGIIVGCSGGTFDNIMAASQIVQGHSTGDNGFSFSVYPGSQPCFVELVKNGAVTDLMTAGATLKPAFCGPCFGAGDTPANNEFALRHSTRNFPNRDGSKPGEGQNTMVALADARTIAATAIHGGVLTRADQVEWEPKQVAYHFDQTIYDNKVIHRWGKEDLSEDLVYGPNIKPWPDLAAMTQDMAFILASHIDDPVTTTDELIPSGETSSYRSNPHRLAEFTLSRKDPGYVGRSKEVQKLEFAREAGKGQAPFAWMDQALREAGFTPDWQAMGIGSAIYANKPGDGSAREQAASSQRVIGGWANFAKNYATKRYRSNLINWGILPFLVEDAEDFPLHGLVYIPGVAKAVQEKAEKIPAYIFAEDQPMKTVDLQLGRLTDKERAILLEGCLINYNKNRR